MLAVAVQGQRKPHALGWLDEDTCSYIFPVKGGSIKQFALGPAPVLGSRGEVPPRADLKYVTHALAGAVRKR